LAKKGEHVFGDFGKGIYQVEKGILKELHLHVSEKLMVYCCAYKRDYFRTCRISEKEKDLDSLT